MFFRSQSSSIIILLLLGICRQNHFVSSMNSEAEERLNIGQSNNLLQRPSPEKLTPTNFNEHGNRSKRGYGNTGYGTSGYGGSDGYGGESYGGAAAIAQQAANLAKSAAAAQGPASYQAATLARKALANRASKAAKQAKDVTQAKQIQVQQISMAANRATMAAYSEAEQSAKAQRALQAAETVLHITLHSTQQGGYGHGAEEQLYAAQSAVESARSLAAWQAQMAHQAQINAWKLAQKHQTALHDLSLAQQATNKALWAATSAKANVGGYGHG